ncbi:hypothetical protein [Actinomyces wuliandei]|uniref:hypothetical protein n=1 Tax=Actinomyces wuliandei TaxID=2057743 RepID=UPI00111B849E|nr:hypothetical protein [Actinomyces wuliandei]
MATVEETVNAIISTGSWDERVAQMRLVAQRHGTAEHTKIYAEVANQVYVPHLAPDFAYVHSMDFYELSTFQASYRATLEATQGFTDMSQETVTRALLDQPRSLLTFRTVLGLLTKELASATTLVSSSSSPRRVSPGVIEGMERHGTRPSEDTAMTLALTLVKAMDGTLFGDPPDGLRTKQDKFDTRDGWATAAALARDGVPYEVFLHQRHYGGHFRQLLDATSTQRGNILEDAVEDLFLAHGIPHIRTGSHNQAEIAEHFEIHVAPAPDFVVYDQSHTLRAMLECKLTSDGGTARDKAHRFERLRAESVRLGGVPLVGVLAGLGWTRVNDTLGPVIRDTDGRVFTLSDLTQMLSVSPFPQLIGAAPA